MTDSFPEYAHGQCAIRNTDLLCHAIGLQVERHMLSKFVTGIAPALGRWRIQAVDCFVTICCVCVIV